MHRKTRRPAHCAPSSFTDARQLGERLRVSRERLATSELATSGMAWRLWAACVEATFGYARQADQVYATTLGNAAGVHRSKVGALLRRFDELDVFDWDAAPRGSHGISELRLPELMYRPRCMNEPHAPPAVSEEPSTRTAQGSLQQYVTSSESHRSIGTANVGEEVGALEELTRDELDRRAYRALVDGDEARLEAIRNEAHRRDASHSALATFGEPMQARRRAD